MSSFDLASISSARRLIIGAAVVLFIASFLPWYHVSVSVAGFHASASASGWHQIGVVAWLLTIVLILVEGARIAGVLPLDESRSDLATLAASAATLLFGVIYVIVRLSDGNLGFGFWIGVVGLIGLAVGAFQLFSTGTATTALKNMQTPSTGGDAGGTPPPAPPA